MAKELLKEAIADAKAVREVAMQNAKLALEEAFNSKIQSMLAAKLNEELDEEEELEEVYNEDEDNMEEGSYMEDEKEMEEGMEYEEDEFEEPIDYTMGKGSGPGTNQLPNPPAEINLEEILASLEEEMEEELDEEINLTLEEDEDEELEEEINLDALMEELMEEETVEEVVDYVGKEATNESSEEALNEAYSTIETLRTQLAEVNLLNAKLLYVNKLFKANNLTEAQKLKVVEALDEATNVKEAKLVFNTLKESFESTGLKKNITEGFGYASKATGAPAKKKILTEQVDETVARFQKLANIKF